MALSELNDRIRALPADEYILPKRYVDCNGLNICYVEQGEGEVILCIHGLGASLDNYSYNIQDLSDDFRVVALDLPGFGSSGIPDTTGSYTLDMFASYIEEFCDCLGLKDVTLIGHSFGGHVAMCTAVTYPDLIRRLVLVDSAGVSPIPRWPIRIVIRLFLSIRRNPGPHPRLMRMSLKRAFFNPHTPYLERMMRRYEYITHREDFRHRIRAGYRAILAMLDKPLKPHLSKIQAPTLIIWGRNDRSVRASVSGRILDANIPNPRLVVIPQCGHCPQIERPEEFNKLVREFILHTAS